MKGEFRDEYSILNGRIHFISFYMIVQVDCFLCFFSAKMARLFFGTDYERSWPLFLYNKTSDLRKMVPLLIAIWHIKYRF